MDEVYPLERELNLLEPRTLRLWRDGFADLVLEYEGTRHAGVRLVRSFPHSAAQRMLSVRDAEGEELGIIADLRDLDPESRRIAAEELEQLYFVPRITRVVDIAEHFHVPRWKVETDRGLREFEIRSGRQDIRVTGNRILIRDADGSPFEIPDYRGLDAASRALIESQV